MSESAPVESMQVEIQTQKPLDPATMKPAVVPYQLRHLTEQAEIADLKAEIKLMDDHLRSDPSPFCDQAPDFQDNYFRYKQLVKEKSARTINYVNSLVSEHYSQAQADAISRILSNPSPYNLEGDTKFVEFAAATRGKCEELQDKCSQLEEAMERQKQEREEERRQMEEQSRKRSAPYVNNTALMNKYQKQADTDVRGGSASTSKAIVPSFTPKSYGSQQTINDQSLASASRGDTADYSLLNCGDVLGRRAINEAVLNKLAMPEKGGYVKKPSYQMGSEIYELFTEFQAGIQSGYLNATAANNLREDKQKKLIW